MTWLLWLIIGIVGRIIIHIPDATPLSTLCLLAPTVFSKKQAFLATALVLLLSDFLLHYFLHYPVFGSWTLFTYTGWCGVTLLGLLLAQHNSLLRALTLTLLSSLLFWTWTNFGTWCMTTLYMHTLSGLLACYIAALPFLQNSVLGGLAWMTLIQLLLRYHIIHRHIPAIRY